MCALMLTKVAKPVRWTNIRFSTFTYNYITHVNDTVESPTENADVVTVGTNRS